MAKKGISKHWLWLLVAALALGWIISPSTEVEVPGPEVEKIVEVPVEVEKIVEVDIDYLEIAMEEAMAEFVDDLDDEDVDVTWDRIYDKWSVSFDRDEPDDFVVEFEGKLELFNQDDFDDADDEDEDYDAPTVRHDFVVKWDESRNRFRVSW